MGAALLAAAVDVVGIVINIAVLPDLARELQHLRGAARDAVLVYYSAAETLAQALTDMTAFGLYTVAGLLVVPAVFATHG